MLRELRTSPVTEREMMRARRTVLTRHESDLKDNNYCLGLLTHLQVRALSVRGVGMFWASEGGSG